MEYGNRLYLLLHPSMALLGSQLTPEQLARHYTVGPTRHYRGKVIFAEIDPGFRHPHFAIESALAELKPHNDGRPKATKFISSYRVLEHVGFQALKSLYLTSAEGYCLCIDAGSYVEATAGDRLMIYAEITPLRMLVLSRLDLNEFGDFITDPSNPIGAPKFFYTQIDLDTEEFLEDYEQNPLIPSPIHNLHPSVLRDAIRELESTPHKASKGLSLQSNIDNISFKSIRRGFMFASQNDRRFYPMPSLAEIEDKNLRFWRGM